MCEEAPSGRTREAARDKLARAVPEVLESAEYRGLQLDDAERAEFVADADVLLDNYFRLEDPSGVNAIGTELRMSVSSGTLTMSGIIDRLDLDEDGELTVTDYKTGRAPASSFEQPRLGGVHFYAYLCERLLGRRPARVQLLHLREPIAISTTPSDQSIRALEQQASALWSAVRQACEREDFRPKPGRMCEYCAYHEFCPAQGGDLSRVAAHVVERAVVTPVAV
jgi:putative RecB family exonuclease